MNPNQQENESGIQKNFLSKIKQNYSNKFSNISLSSSIQNMSIHSDHDGNSEDDTLIHNAFVKYFDSKGEPYPEWLGVKTKEQNSRPSNSNSNSHYRSEYQPVYSSYNSGGQGASQNQQNQNSGTRSQAPSYFQPQHTPHNASQNTSQHAPQHVPEAEPQRPTYTPRSSSRLQDMYNKSRQQSIPGSGYNTQSYPSGPLRTNSSTTGSRLRERMLNTSPSMNGLNQATKNNNPNTDSSGNSKATWGRR
ncbi:DEHA2F10692p [Debaryomyces hansenii CBS767]|uniref:DEHA2F10692p n=1 Tax=Debaryomyces hansenii (strain ATCC 36239 / CBS 767 / BCRC 21394 / JCM 1990 / NBRC 0083 / IGC 2968) TaxID=284592 RepID=Q6BLU3_DEBHA|nr:DEHA2F10692p [Debaryomyces hansenii CBS767]CAG89173.1 DEHA2F10692p [Debaryomyces hansenii CBS767]|eukprot:XP_460828.1 DEHA2F10692p [Debaryomyces hansenii CBS767]